MQRVAVLLVMLLIFPVYSASPPPGEPEVENDICSTWNSQNGVCDDYQSNLDGSTFSEWIKSSIIVNVVNADSVSLTISTAVHELSRSDLDLEDLDLEGDSSLEDGIPADYIRNYLDFERNGFTIEERMVSLIQTNMREYIEDNFDYTEDSLLNTISSVDFSSTGDLQCTYDNSQDSIDEVNGLMNDPFNPPICFRGVFILTLNPDNLGIKENTGDLDRIIRGLLLMGGDVESSFNAKALPGHYVELTVSPPEYSTAFEIDEPGILLTKNIPNQLPQRYGHLSLDNTVSEDINSDISESLVMRIKNRESSSILSIDNHQPSLSIDVLIDARDSSNTEIEMILSIHYLASDTLDNWLVDFEDDEMNIPIITSDGIRMLDYELEEDLSPLLQGIPIEEISTSFSELFGTEIDFIQPTFSASDDLGGLDFRHQNGETCDEMLEVRYCLDGENAMSGTNPIYIQSSSQPVQVQLSNIIQNMLGSSLGDVSTLDFSILNDEDLAAAMSIVEVDFSANSEWLQEILPDDFPDTNINLELLLPEWIRSTSQENHLIEIKSLFHEDEIYESGFEGTRIFDWRHPICLNSDPCEDSSNDLVCSSKQSTCFTSKAEFYIKNIAINELSGEINIDFDAELTFSIHRLNVDLGEDNIELIPIPSDLIRRAIAIGDRKDLSFDNQINDEGGLLGGSEITAPLDFGNGNEINITISNSGMSQFAEDLNEIFPAVISDPRNEISGFPLDLGFGKYELNANLISTPFQFNAGYYEIPETIIPNDLNPINFSASIDNAEMSFSSIDDQINLDVHRSSYEAPLSLFEWPFGDPITSDFGITFENSQMQQKIFPIMEHTIFGTIRSSSLIIIHMPDEIRLSSFESSNERGNINEIEGKQVLTYLTPVCPEALTWNDCKKNSDLVTYNLEYSWSFIFVELAPYAIILISLLVLFSFRLIRRRKEKKFLKIQEQELLQSELTEVAAIEAFGSMDSPVVVANESYFEKEEIMNNE
jgi:hypothetical protein